jgi:hypothetical protein
MKILHLTLKKIWFDQIASETKTIEYREVKPYWTARIENKEYDEIHFRNGYSKDCPFMRVEYKGYTKRNNNYEIHLGKILEIK